MDDIFATVNELARGAPSPPVEKQLVDPAKYIFVCLFQHSAKFEGESLAAWSKLVEELGSPEALQEEYRKSSV